jgi:hypothetical protein
MKAGEIPAFPGLLWQLVNFGLWFIKEILHGYLYF